MKRIKHIILTLFALLALTKTFGQNYPVQSFVQINQPYSSYLPDYADPFNNQLKILLTLTDFTVPSHQVKIKIKLSGNGYAIETKDNLNLPPIVLTPGVPVEVSGSALAPYLATENLNFSGIDVNNYLQTKVLPEGPCQICVDIIDFNSPTGTLLGNPACAQAWFERLQPPFANTPFCGDTLSVNNPQVVLFNWTPVTSNSPSTFTTEYVFELYENTAGIDIDPNVLVATTLPVSIITTPNAFINYGMTEYQLQVGKQYVWRVQARNTEGRDLYVNNGYSAVCSFVYGSLVESITAGIELELQTNGTGSRQGNAIWNANSIFDYYILEVRKTGDPSFEWFPYETEMGVPTTSMKINGLEPETEYEARIKGYIGNEFESEYSNLSVFTTNPTPNYQCGSEAMPATAPNIVPLQNATFGMIFTVGQFEMLVTSIEPLGQAGHYKGTGKIVVPFLLSILNVSYQDILVDDNLMVREGKVEAITDGIESWERDQLLAMAVPHYADVEPSNIAMTNDSSGVLVTFNGVDSTFNFPGNGIPVVINVAGGLQIIIWPDGTQETGTWGNISDDALDATQDYFVYFEADPNQAYGFDAFDDNYTVWAENYENILLSDNSPYYVSYKSTAWNTGDHVIAKLQTDSAALDLTFTIDGDELDASHVTKINDFTYDLNLDGYMETYSENVYAYDSYGRKIGKLRVIPYENKTIEVYVVPVNNAQINQPNLQADLNNIYKVANTQFNVTIQPSFVNNNWDLNGDGLEVTGPELLAVYSDEMRKLRTQYFDSSGVDRDKQALYIFVVDQFDNPNQDGYMVKGQSLGFVKNNPSVKTIAHEIGHGAFKLEHTFPQVAQSSTNNLLDYGSGTNLTKPQWEQIFNTQITFSFLDSEEDNSILTLVANMNRAEYVWINSDPILSYGFDGFYTPGGDKIKLNDVSKVSHICFDILTGGVSKFKYDGKVYTALYTRGVSEGNEGVGQFQGYYIADQFHQKIDGDLAVLGEEWSEEKYNLNFINTFIDNNEIEYYYFCDYTFASPNDEVISLLNSGVNVESCVKSVYKWESGANTNQSNLDQTNNSHYSFPISNVFLSISYDDVSNRTLLDNLHGDDLEADKQRLLCLLSEIYSDLSSENYLARRLIEKRLYEKGYQNISQVLNEEIAYLEYLVQMTQHLKNLGVKLFNVYNIEIRKNKYEAWENIFYDLPDNSSLSYEQVLQKFNALTTKLFADIKTIETPTDNDALVLALDGKTINELELLSVETKLKALNLMTSTWMFNREEAIVNKIIQSINTPNEIVTFIDGLREIPFFEDDGKSTLLEWLIYRIDFSDYSTFWRLLIEKFQTYYAVNQDKYTWENINFFTYANNTSGQFGECNDVGDCILSDFSFQSGNRVTVKYKVVNGCNSYYNTGNYNAGPYNANTYELPQNVVTADMYAPFVMVNKSDIPLVGQGLPANLQNPIIVPAVFVKYLYDKEFEQTMHEVIQAVAIAIDIATLCTGPGLILKAYQAGRYFVVVYEASQVAASALNVVVNATGYESELVNSFNVIVGAWGLYRGGTNLLHNWGAIKQSADNLTYRPITTDEAQTYINNFEATVAHEADNGITVSKINQDQKNLYKRLVQEEGITYNSNILDNLPNGVASWMDDVFDLQKSVVNQNKNIIANASNNAKGAWGEMSSDVFLTQKGYQPLHLRKTDLTQGWGESGIDGIFKKDGQYYIVEAKYSGTSTLKMTNDGKQMSDPWIQSSNRLDDILGPVIAQELRETGNYTRLLAKTAPDGTITYKVLNSNATVVGDFTP
ncbi:MAG: hypothetical protein ACWA41_01815 [Putridiphycobacter sp.]